MKTKLQALLGFALLAALGAGCTKHSSPNFIYMPDMAYSPALKYQEPGMMPPVKGTVPRGFHPMPAAMTVEEASRTLTNPLQRTGTVLARGQQMFNTYCIVCHGPNGEGDGTIVPRFPRPPSLQSDKIVKATDGHIYYVIARGQNLMPPYASQIQPSDRWAIVNYIRALQRSKHPSDADVKAADAE